DTNAIAVEQVRMIMDSSEAMSMLRAALIRPEDYGPAESLPPTAINHAPQNTQPQPPSSAQPLAPTYEPVIQPVLDDLAFDLLEREFLYIPEPGTYDASLGDTQEEQNGRND